MKRVPVGRAISHNSSKAFEADVYMSTVNILKLSESEIGKRVLSPSHNSLVAVEIDGNFCLAVVESGAYERNSQISNTWTIRLVDKKKRIQETSINFMYSTFNEYMGELDLKLSVVNLVEEHKKKKAKKDKRKKDKENNKGIL